MNQYIELREYEGGVLVPKKNPSNAELLKKALERVPPATKVYRHLWLPNELPDEYAWVKTAESSQTTAYLNCYNKSVVQHFCWRFRRPCKMSPAK